MLLLQKKIIHSQNIFCWRIIITKGTNAIKSLVESYFVKKHNITINLTVKLQICQLYASIREAFKNWCYQCSFCTNFSFDVSGRLPVSMLPMTYTLWYKDIKDLKTVLAFSMRTWFIGFLFVLILMIGADYWHKQSFVDLCLKEM